MSVQAQLERCTKNQSVYDRISSQMKDAWYSRTAVQCRGKIKKLRQECKRVKDNNGLTGRRNYFDQLDAIFGHRPAIRPPVILDTLADEESIVVECAEENAQEGVSGRILQDDNDSDLPLSRSSVPSSEVSDETVPVDENEEENDELQQSHEEKEKKDTTAVNSRKRKRPSRRDIIEQAMEGVIKKAAKEHEKSDLRYLEMEEKRLEFDKLMLEMENQHWKEESDRRSSIVVKKENFN